MNAIEELRALPRVSIQKTYISGGNATCVAGRFVESSEAEAIVTRQQSEIDDLKRQLAEVTSERDECKAMASREQRRQRELREEVSTIDNRLVQRGSELSQAREQLAAVQAEAAAYRRAVSFANGEVANWVRQGKIDDRWEVVQQTLSGVLYTTAGRDMLDEMKRKDERIAELERAQEPTPEPVWQYRRGGVFIYRTQSGEAIDIRRADGQWCDSRYYPNWQACVDDPSTYPCDEHGQRIEEKSVGQEIVDSLQSFGDKLASGEEIRGTRVTIKDGEVTSEKDVVVIPADEPLKVGDWVELLPSGKGMAYLDFADWPQKITEISPVDGFVYFDRHIGPWNCNRFRRVPASVNDESCIKSFDCNAGDHSDACPLKQSSGNRDELSDSRERQMAQITRERDAYNERCDELRHQLAAQAPLVAIARELREWISSNMIINGNIIRYKSQCQAAYDGLGRLLIELRDSKGGDA